MRLDEVNWAKFLPYERGSEDADFVQLFVSQLKLNILGGNDQATSALLTHLDSGYNVLSLEMRVDVCRVLYELVTTQTLSLNLFSMCCTTLSRILAREESITVDDLELDWRKLYDLMKELAIPKIWLDNPIQRRNKLKSTVELTCAANRLFSPAAAMDVFKELLPQIQFNSLDRQLTVIQFINLFVPTAYSKALPKQRQLGATASCAEELKQSVPRSGGGGEATTVLEPKQWLPTIYSLWSFNLRTSSYDAYFMNLVTFLVIEQKGRLRLTNDQIRFAFASGLHFFNLPVTRGSIPLPRGLAGVAADTAAFYRLPNGGVLPLSEERAHTFARLIVNTIYDESPGGTIELFEQLVQMIEPFYHPSNNGSWSGILARFLRHLAKELTTRVRYEMTDDCQIPMDMRLTRRIRRRFVVSVRPLAMLLLFSKGEDSISMSHSTLKYLSEIEPDLVFEPLLETLYASIDSVTETHRMISAMRALAKLASTLSSFSLYPEGAQHVAPFLILTLPGIDVNDPTKAWFALTFVRNLCINGVVFEELPVKGDMPVPRHTSRPSSSVSQSGSDALAAEDVNLDAPPEVDMEYVEWVTRASTAQFETWIDQYLRRIFALVENLSSSLDTGDAASSSTASTPETGLQMMIAYTTEVVLQQSSERYYPMITRLITNFATNITSLSAVEATCKIVYAFASAMPEHALQSLLPICCERIADEVSNGVGASPSLSRHTRSHSETTLVWFASMLSILTECKSGNHLLAYKEQITSTIKLLLDSCLSRQVYTIANKILYNTVVASTRTYTKHGHSVPDHVWNDPEFRQNHYRCWGQHPMIDDPAFAIDWHVPIAEEIEFAQDILRTVVVPKIGQLNELVETMSASGYEPTTYDNVRLHRLLTTLRYSVRTLGSLIPPPGDSIANDAIADSLIEGDDATHMPPRYRIDGQVKAGYLFTDKESDRYKEISEMRRSIGEASLKTLAYMTSQSEDDVENAKASVRLAQEYICNYGIDRITYSGFRRAWNFGLDSFSINNKICRMPRHYAAKRAMFMQAARLLHNARFMAPTELQVKITDQIVHFCLSMYSEIRGYAITALENVVSVLPGVKAKLVPRFLQELDDNEDSDPEKMLGALQVLHSSPIRQACLRDWKQFPSLVLALCRAQHEDKPQVKKQIRSTAVSQIVYVSAPQSLQKMGDNVKALLGALGDPQENQDSDLDSRIAVVRARQQAQYEFAQAENAKLIGSLVDILRNTDTTWNFASIAGYYLDQLSSTEAPLEPNLLRTLTENLTSDLVLIRESSVVALSQMLSKLKRRSKVNCPDINVASRRQTVDLEGHGEKNLCGTTPYTELCEKALLEHSGDKSNRSSEINSVPFVDSPAVGWFVWPQKVKIYSTPEDQDECVAFDQIDPESKEAYQVVRDIILADGKWDRIAKLFSLENNRSPEEEVFGITRTMLYTQLFSLLEVELLEKVFPAMEKLAHEYERIGAQRAAAEMVGGLLRGSKHWSKRSLDRMWELLIPMLKPTLSKLKADTTKYWQTGLKYAFARRDPRRYLPLIRFIIYENTFDPQSEMPFTESSKLDLMAALITCWDWRIAPAILASKPRLLEALAHPYKQVRDAAGLSMYALSAAEHSVSYTRTDIAIADLARYGSTGRDFSYWAGTERTQTLIKEMTNRVEEWKKDHVPLSEGTSNYSRGCKTLLTYFLAGFGYSSRRIAIEHVPSFLPMLSALQEQHDDDDLSRMAKLVLQFFSQLLYTAHVSESVATKMLELLQDSSAKWHVVTKTLPLLCTLIFSNRFTLSRDIHTRIVDTTASFLGHEQIEVRQAASASLTSLVKCASNQVISEINVKFSAKITDTRLPRVRYGRPVKNPKAYNRKILARHAGVLGLSCLVLAFPYTIPDWLPEVLVLLAGCIDDPSPIQGTVQHTFAEFRRTHMDTWHEDRKRFTASQLELLTDMLVSPCYYA